MLDTRRTYEPGIYYDLDFETYRQIPALNQSVLKLMDEDVGTPLHAKAAFDGELERSDSTALRLGRAEHLWIVEGEEAFRRSQLVAPDECGAKKADGKPCTSKPSWFDGDNWTCKTHASDKAEKPESYCHEADLERIKRMAESVRNHEINKHLSRPGWSEATIVWDVDVSFGVQYWEGNLPKSRREETTLRHKARIDRLAEPKGNMPHLILDLKRMQVLEGSRFKREKTIRRYSWDVQSAMYTEAVKHAFGVDRCHYAWIFIEEKPPYDVVWFPASQDTLRIGRDKLDRFRREWAMCQHTGRWRGYCQGDQEPGGLPQHYVKNYLEMFADDSGILQGDLT